MSIFTAAAFLIRPTYRASAVLLPVATDSGSLGNSLGAALGSLGGVASLVGLGLQSDSDSEQEALAVLKSREFLQRFIQDKNLMPVLYEDDWDQARQRWKDPDSAPTLATAHKHFVEDILAVVEDGTSSLVTIHIDWHDREAAASWANELVDRLNEEMRSRALRQAAASLGFLQAELKATNLVGIQEVINHLIETQISKRMLANVTHEYAFRIVDRAMPPDEDDPLRPSKPLFLVLGFILGILIGVIGVLVTSPTSFRLRAVGGARNS